MASNDLKRPAPAYQVWPASEAANETNLLMPNGPLGLKTRMDWRCWVNGSVPAAPALLARLLGISEEEVRADLTPAVLSFFRAVPGAPDRLESPELVRQANRQAERHRLQSQAAADTNAKLEARRASNAHRNAKRDGSRNGDRIASQYNTAQHNPNPKPSAKVTATTPLNDEAGATEAERLQQIGTERAAAMGARP